MLTKVILWYTTQSAIHEVATLGSKIIYWYELTFILAWMSNHISSKVWDGITYPSPNFNGCAIEIWEWASNFTPILQWMETYMQGPLTRNVKLLEFRGGLSIFFKDAYCWVPMPVNWCWKIYVNLWVSINNRSIKPQPSISTKSLRLSKIYQ